MGTRLLPVGQGKKRLLMGGVWGECLAEFLGTFVLLAFGDGSVAVALVGLPGSGRETAAFGAPNWLIIGWGWGLAVVFGVYVAGGISGAHLNPAVTLAFAVRRKFAWKKVLPYMGAQLVGAFTGAALVYADFYEAINLFDRHNHVVRSVNGLATFSIFATFPAAYYRGLPWAPFVDQVIMTGFLVMFVAAIIDTDNMGPLANMGPFLIGLVVVAIGFSFGTNSGYAINPARDLGPRLFADIVGWGKMALPGTVNMSGAHFSDYMWVPIVGPLVGGVAGIVIYDLIIGQAIKAKAALTAGVPAGRASEGRSDGGEAGADEPSPAADSSARQERSG